MKRFNQAMRWKHAQVIRCMYEWEDGDIRTADEEQLKGQREGVEGKRSQCHGFPKESGTPAGSRTIKPLFILSGEEGGG